MQQSLTLPSLPPTTLSKPHSQSTIKFKKLPVLKDDIIPARLFQRQPINKQLSQSLPKRNISSISLMDSSQRKQHKKQKLMINLIEKKIRQGRYNQNEQVSTDLNSLKGEQSQYTTKLYMLEIEIGKLKQRLSDVKGEKEMILCDQSGLNNRLEKIKRDNELWKQKCDQAEYEKAVHMNLFQRQTADYKLIENKVSYSKQELKKKKGQEETLNKKEVDFFQKEKLTERKYFDLKKSTNLENKKIKEMLGDKEKSVQLRALGEIQRWERKRQLIQISQTVIIEQSEKAFNKQYHKILANLFLSNLMDQKFERLIQKNERMIELFNQASNTYGPLQPQQYHFRYFNSEVQRNSIKQNIKQLEKVEFQCQVKNKKLQQKLSELNTQYQQMGLLLEKENSLSNLNKTINKNMNHNVDEKIFSIESWLSNSSRRLSDAGFQTPQKAQSNFQCLKLIMQQIKTNLLQQTNK